MSKSLFAIAAAIVCAFGAQAQSLTIHIQDAVNGNALEGVTVSLTKENAVKTKLTNPNGDALFKPISPSQYQLRLGFIGYETNTQEVAVESTDKQLVIQLKPIALEQKQVTVNAINTNNSGAYAFTNYKQADLAKQNFGQDIPLLLQFSPSAVATSDAGNGVGYSGLRIRGSDATRLNVTLNGIPVNDAESQGLYWVNMPDLASSTSKIQIQRGVGTSTNGAAAFGGSINIETEKLQYDPYAEVSNSYGSFNTWKNTARYGTGLVNKHFAFNGRLSQIKSDGFIDRASSLLQSYYLDGGYFGKKDMLKVVIMSGKEKTYQAWNGVPAETYANNRTFNEFTYPNQTDNYTQSHYQAHYTHTFSERWNLGMSTFYTRGKGYYEEAQYTSNPYAETALSIYGINPVTLKAGQLLPGTADSLTTDSTITSSDIIRRKWLDNHFYGTVGNLTYTSKKLNVVLGGGANQYQGGHYGEVIWARYALNSYLGDRYYNNTARKTDCNVYGKLTYTVYNNLNTFLDLQYRRVNYSFKGDNAKQQDASQNVALSMFNPKAGLSYNLNNGKIIYASWAVAQREPNRNDYVNAIANQLPKKELLNDFEAGFRKTKGKVQLGFNAFYMNYQNQLILTGQLNEVGDFIRTNVGSSYRAGLEMEFGTQITTWLNWNANLTLSQNKVRSFVNIVRGYNGPNDYLRQDFSKTNIAYSPNVVGANLLSASIGNWDCALITKYVGSQYLDNTQNNNSWLNGYALTDLRLKYKLPYSSVGNVELGLLLNNIFNNKYVSNGYTFSGLNPDASVTNYNYYYPQAGFNLLGSISIRF